MIVTLSLLSLLSTQLDEHKKTGGNKVVSAFLVFLLSSFIHEYILSVGFGFVFPVLFIQFSGFGSKHQIHSSSLPSFNFYKKKIVLIFFSLFCVRLALIYLAETAIKKGSRITVALSKGDHETEAKQQLQAYFYPSNFFILATSICGWASMLVFYSFEYFARQNCALPQVRAKSTRTNSIIQQETLILFAKYRILGPKTCSRCTCSNVLRFALNKLCDICFFFDCGSSTSTSSLSFGFFYRITSLAFLLFITFFI
jgi:hypothetical protein